MSLFRFNYRIPWFLLSIWRACIRWIKCDCVDMSAAFAYYVLQSIFPLLLITLSLGAKLFGSNSGLENILLTISPWFPPSVVALIESTLTALVEQRFGAGILGIVVLLVTASNAYLTLQRGADRLWRDLLPTIKSPPPISIQALIFLRNRLEAFLVVLLLSILIIAEQLIVNLGKLPDDLVSSIWTFSPDLVGALSSIPIFSFGQILIQVLWLSLIALILQKVLPSRRVPWFPLIPGSVLIGVLLTILNSVLSLSILSLGARFQAYGVISGVLVLTLWIWLIGVILYFGQCWSVELASARISISN